MEDYQANSARSKKNRRLYKIRETCKLKKAAHSLTFV